MKKLLFWFLLIIILFSGIFFYWKYSFTYSEGYRAGLLQKFSRKGTLFKTYEGEMILSSIQSNANVAIASEKFLFSVTDPVLATQLERMQGDNIVVHYLEKNAILSWRGESRYIVDSVRTKERIMPPPAFREDKK
jgi:hypothetical protein